MMLKKKKALFITHDISLYGASRSLQTLIRNLKDVEVDLVVRKRFFRRNNLQQVRSFFGSNVQSVQEFHLPFDPSYVGRNANQLILNLTKMLWLKDATKLRAYIQAKDYDFIHLNSLVLHDIIHKDFPFFIHIRDIYDGSNSRVLKSLEEAEGVIFIDDATKKPFCDLPLANSIVLNNPFDMRHLSEVQPSEALASFKGKTVFSIIGKVVKVKGVDLVIEAFKQVPNEHAVLLIVGDGGDKAYTAYCKELAKDDARIIFHGEEPSVEKIYAISDFVLRADPQFCIGRTIFEGLYAGCHVIMPGEEADKVKIFEYHKFADKLSLYPAGSVSALTNVLQSNAANKVTDRVYDSNVEAYVKSFNRFVYKSLDSRLPHL